MITHSKLRIISYYAARIAPGLVNLFLAIIVGGALNDADYGRFSLFQALYLGLASFVYGWLIQSVAKYSNGDIDYLRTEPDAFLLGGLVNTIITTIFISISLLFYPDQIYILSIGICIIFQGWHSFFIATHQARFKHSYYVISEIFRALIIILTLSFTYAFNGKLNHYLLGFVFAYSFIIIFDLFLARNNFDIYPLSFFAPRKRLNLLFSYGYFISLWLGVFMIWPALERMLVGHLAGEEYLGVYSINYDLIFRSFVFIMLPLTLLAQPSIFRDYSLGDLARAKNTIKKTLVIQILFGLFFATIYYLLIPLLAQFFKAFKRIDPTLFVLFSMAAIIWQIALVLHKPFECLGKTDLMFFTLIVSIFGVSLPCTLLLYDTYSAKIFPFSVFLGGFFYCGISYFFGFRRLINYKGS